MSAGLAQPAPHEIDAMAAALGAAIGGTLATRLYRYLDLLAHWNGTYNLTAVRTREGMLTQHLADCLVVVSPLARQLPANLDAPRLLDVGSGGGLPGVVLAACLPQLQVTCVDAVAKKAAFVRQVAAELGLNNLQSVHARVETMPSAPFDVISSRAFASLADFTQLTRTLLAPNGQWLAMKGKTPAEELTQLPDDVEMFHVEPLTVPGLDAQRCLIWMRPKVPA